MKTMHLLRGILCLTAFMALLPLSAQHNKDINLRWGVTAGMNGFNANSLNLSDHRGRYGFNIAARAELDFANSMYLDAELGLLNLGWKNRVSYYYSDYYNPDTPIGDYTETDFTQRMNAYYLHLPIHAGYHWSVARRCAIYVDAGPYFSLGLFGKAKTTDHIKNETHKADTFDQIRRFDWGLGARLGVELAGHYRLGMGYDFGLQKLSKYSSDKNNNFTLSVGYMF